MLKPSAELCSCNSTWQSVNIYHPNHNGSFFVLSVLWKKSCAVWDANMDSNISGHVLHSSACSLTTYIPVASTRKPSCGAGVENEDCAAEVSSITKVLCRNASLGWNSQSSSLLLLILFTYASTVKGFISAQISTAGNRVCHWSYSRDKITSHWSE